MRRNRVLVTSHGTRPEAFGLVEWGLLAAVAGIWGASFLFIAEGLEAFEPLFISWARVLLGAMALSLFPASRIPVQREDRGRIATLAFMWMAFPLALFPIAQQWIDSSLAGMLNGAVPLFAGAFAALFLRRLPRHLQAVGLAVGFAGVVLVALPSTDGASATALGIGLILVAVASYGLSLNLAVPLQQKYGALPVINRAQWFAVLMLTPFGLWDLARSEWQTSSALAVVVLGVAGTGLAFVAMANLAGRAGATRGSVAIYFVPIVAIALGVGFRDESVAFLSLVGIALVLGGAWLSSRRER